MTLQIYNVRLPTCFFNILMRCYLHGDHICVCVAPTMLEELCKRNNIVALRFGDQGAKETSGVVGSNV